MLRVKMLYTLMDKGEKVKFLWNRSNLVSLQHTDSKS